MRGMWQSLYGHIAWAPHADAVSGHGGGGNTAPYGRHATDKTNEDTKVSAMPLTKKGKKILDSMEKEYGSKKGKSVFYASVNSGRVKGAEPKKRRK